jgi:hypothetical protein
LLSFEIPGLHTGVDTAAEAAIVIIAVVYAIAAGFNLKVPDTGAHYPHQERNPWLLVKDFGHCLKKLWGDSLGQISLAVTTLFWGAGATLQFIILKWAEVQLGMALSSAAKLQGVVAIGIAVGAVLAARYVSLRGSLSVLRVGIAMGVLVPLMTLISSVEWAYPLLIIVGGLAGFFVVPMNALLQHRGHLLMSAGHSIAVQNFNENLSVLLMLGLYSLLIQVNLSVNIVIWLFGLFIAAAMTLVLKRHQMNQAKFDSVSLIGKH